MKRKIYIRVIFYLVVLIALGASFILNLNNGIRINAINGYSNLENFDFDNNIAILDGAWVYNSSDNSKSSQTNTYLEFPVEWKKLSQKHKVIQAGSYVMHLKVKKMGLYQIQVNSIPCAYELYVNGKMIGKSGDTEGINEQELVWNAGSFLCHIENEDVDIELRTSEVYYKRLTNVHHMIFGKYDLMNRTYVVSVIRSVMFIGMFIGYGIYLLMLHEPGSTKKGHFQLGIFGLAMANLELIIGMSLYQYFFPAVKLFYVTKTSIIVLLVGSLSYSLYILGIDNEENENLKKIICIANIAYILLVLISNFSIFHMIKYFYLVLLSIDLILPLVSLIVNIKEKKKYSVLNLSSYFFVIATALNDMFERNMEQATVCYSGTYSVGIALFLLCQMYVLAQRSVDQYHESCEKKDMEIAFLQAQIAPHFFFNTLNNIYCMMDTEQAKAKTILMDFCDFLRVKYKFDYRTEVYYSLLEEVDMVESFVRIENERYDHRIEFSLNIEKDCEDVQIPPLLLQPIVENAIKHGMSNDKLKIHLTAKKVNDNVEIQIQDNGKGMGIEQIRKIAKQQVGKSGIGLRNIIYRLKKCYKTELCIESSIGKGTIVRLQIPTKRKVI